VADGFAPFAEAVTAEDGAKKTAPISGGCRCFKFYRLRAGFHSRRRGRGRGGFGQRAFNVKRRGPGAELGGVALVEVVHQRIQLLGHRVALVNELGNVRGGAAAFLLAFGLVGRVFKVIGLLAEQVGVIRLVAQFFKRIGLFGDGVGKGARGGGEHMTVVAVRQLERIQQRRIVRRRGDAVGAAMDAAHFFEQRQALGGLGGGAAVKIGAAFHLVGGRAGEGGVDRAQLGEERLRLGGGFGGRHDVEVGRVRDAKYGHAAEGIPLVFIFGFHNFCFSDSPGLFWLRELGNGLRPLPNRIKQFFNIISK
jgi:hypothetical protein